jgi:hypothetical protein
MSRMRSHEKKRQNQDTKNKYMEKDNYLVSKWKTEK